MIFSEFGGEGGKRRNRREGPGRNEPVAEEGNRAKGRRGRRDVHPEGRTQGRLRQNRP